MGVGTAYKHYELAGDYDTLVIGSGMGGLTAAALLARLAGERVLVLEQHYTAGGFTHAFQRPGFDWDVGVHYIGDVAPGRPLGRIFDYLSDGKLQWADMGEVYDVIEIAGRRYELVKGKEGFRARMKQYFPDEARAIDRYIKLIERANWASTAFFADKALPAALQRVVGPLLRWAGLRVARRTPEAVLRELTSNAELRAVLTAQWGDYGLPPSAASFFVHALIVGHYFGGAAYPIGGAARIAETILPAIEARGGRVLVRAEVQQILLEGGRAVGVRMADGREIRARKVISDAGAAITFKRLLPASEPAVAPYVQLVDELGPSVAHISLHLGLDRSAADLGLGKANRWIYPSADHDQNASAFERDPEAPLPSVFLSFPSAKDPDFERRHPGHATMEVITFLPYAWFERWSDSRWGRREAAYSALKQRLQERLLAVVQAECPGVNGHIVHAELSTPLSTRHFTGHPRGEIYGLIQNARRLEARALQPRTSIPGLYLTGADACSAGVAGALMGGVLTTSVVLGRNVLRSITQGAKPREAHASVAAEGPRTVDASAP